MKQLELNLYPDTVDLHGRGHEVTYQGHGVTLDNEYVEYLGKAKKQNDGTWSVLANVAGMLCLVQVGLTNLVTGEPL